MADSPDPLQSSLKPKRKRKPRVRNPENKKLSCKDCNRKFYFQCQLSLHQLIHTGEKPFACDICGKAFNRPHVLRSHKYIHTNEKPFKCAYCKYACRDSSTLRKHQANHTGTTTCYQCTLCEKSYKCKRMLKAHVSEKHLNMDLKKLPCPHCGKLYKTTSQRNTHIKVVHNREKSGNCPVCGRYLANMDQLNVHLSTHVEARPHVCTAPGCKSAFKDKNSLTKHMVIHFPEEHMPCDICGRLFTRRRRLEYHVVTVHGKRKRVECDHCGVRFYSKAYLINHIQKKHVRKRKKFVCDLCGFVTHNKPSIVMHIKHGHVSESDRECKICHTIYKRNVYLKLHYKRSHNICYKTKPRLTVQIKEEPPEDTESVHSIDLFEIEKSEPCEELNLGPSDAEPPALTTEVECKPIPSTEVNQDEFDQFYAQHVTKLLEKDIEESKESADPTQDGKIDLKALELQKNSKVKILAEARKKQALLALERARQTYNERMKKYIEKSAAEEAENKQPKKIKLFKSKPSKTIKTQTERLQKINKIERDDEIPSNVDNNINSKKSAEENELDNGVDTDKLSYDDKRTSNDEKITYYDDKSNNDKRSSNDDKSKINTVNNNDKSNEGDTAGVENKANGVDGPSDDDANCDDDDEEWVMEKKQKNRKVNYNSHQCYICFKLYDTKENLLDHCKDHFDVCNERFLKKCPLCPFVTKLSIGNHLKRKHGIKLKVPYGQIKDKKDNNNGSRYYFEINDPLVHTMEVIPSVKNLNKIASMKIDKKRREDKDKTLAKTKLVRKGEEWVVETEKIKIGGDIIMPEFDSDVVQNLDKVGDSDAYLDGLKKMSRIAKKAGKTMLFPCQSCEKVCRNFAALKLHNRKHEANPKPFKKKVWKHKLKGGRVDKKPVKVRKPAPDNRTAKPQPIKNKHKCDPELKQFYENNIRGGDIEFWQFLKIFNKMNRDNIDNFEDLESRHEYGIVLPEDRTKIEEPNEDVDSSALLEVEANKCTDKTKKPKIKKRLKHVNNKSGRRMSIEVYNKRNLIKQQLRDKISASSQASTSFS